MKRRDFFAVGGALLLAASGCAGVATVEAPPLPDDVVRVRSLLGRAGTLLHEDAPSKPDLHELYRIRWEFSRTLWSGTSAVLEVIGLASGFRGDRKVLEFIETACATHVPGACRLDAMTAETLADLALREEDHAVRRLILQVLRRHVESTDGKPARLRPETVSALITALPSMDEEQDAFGLAARDHVLLMLGPYHAGHEEALRLLESTIRDTAAPARRRGWAISSYASGSNGTEAHFALAESLLRGEEDASVRRESLRLVRPFAPGAVDTPMEERIFELLRRSAMEDADADVRGDAADAVLGFEDARAVEFVAAFLKREKEATARASVLHGFFMGTFFFERRDLVLAVQSVAADAFEHDADEEVRRAAIKAYLRMVWRTLWIEGDGGTSFDPEALGRLERMAGKIRAQKMSRETRQFIKQALEKEFESKVPEITSYGPYAELKRYLEK